MPEPEIVEVAVPLPVRELYRYTLPPDTSVEPGARVVVPCGGRRLTGVVVRCGVPLGGSEPARLRPLSQVLDAEPVVSVQLIEVLLRLAERTLSPPGLALAAAIPPGTAPRPGHRMRLREAGRQALERGEARGALGKLLWSLGRGPVSEAALRRRLPEVGLPVLERLVRLGWVRREASTELPRVRVQRQSVYRLQTGVDLEALRKRLARAPRQRALVERLAREGELPLRREPGLRALMREGWVLCEERERSREVLPALSGARSQPPRLTPPQHEAVTHISAAVRARRDAGFLLHGITGSGKTEVYLGATRAALDVKRGVIVLVPEISLTHQIVDRFRSRFGDVIAVLHSALSDGERFDQWRQIRSGAKPIVIGARSAVFAPVPDLGLIVIDEEHDGAYRSDDGFRYHARDVAAELARLFACPRVLGSATPDVETAYQAEHGELETLLLPQRVTRRPLPEVEIVDMNRAARQRGRRPVLSNPLRRALVETLAAGQQAILFLNRRGFASMAYCFACGTALRCKHCDVSLVYHAGAGPPRREVIEQGELCCHYCGYREAPSPKCPGCGSPDGALLGFGTERLEEEVATIFPEARVSRLDRDTSAPKGAQRRILGAFQRRESDILIGTQMVAKGHDVPGVTLVGVIAADLGLQFPDFRAGERTFQLLTQVAGRAGRGDELGRVIIQTFLPDHYAIALARTHDYSRFYREELERRRVHGYPPFRALARLELLGREERAVEAAARGLARLAESVPLPNADASSVERLGPAPAPIRRVRDRFRWQLLLLGGRDEVREVARELQAQFKGRFRGVNLRVDLDPLQML